MASSGYSKLRKEYGDVFTIYLGSQRAVVLCGFKTVKAALVDQADEFGARAELPIVEKTSQGFGIVFSNVETWRQQRRFALATLRNFGMGKRSIEERIQEEIGFLMDGFRNMQGSPFNPTFFLRRSVSNIICSVVFGERFQYDDEDFQILTNLIQENLRWVDSFWVQLYGLFPQVMKHLPGPHNRLFENFKEQKQFVAKILQKHKGTLEPASPRDYIDAFLIRMLAAVLYDPTQFKAPDTFDPGHFLDERGKFKNNAAFMPSSAGKRACPGEGLARMELFLYLTTLLQNFTLTSPVSSEDIDISPEYSGFGKAPRQYQLCLISR